MKIVKTELKGVYSRELSGKQVIEFLEFTQGLGELTPSKNLEIACLLISMGICSRDGKPLYTKEEAMDLPYADIQYLSDKVTDTNKMGEKDTPKKAISDKS